MKYRVVTTLSYGAVESPSGMRLALERGKDKWICAVHIWRRGIRVKAESVDAKIRPLDELLAFYLANAKDVAIYVAELENANEREQQSLYEKSKPSRNPLGAGPPDRKFGADEAKKEANQYAL